MQTKSPGCCTDLKDILTPELFKALADPTRLEILRSLATSDSPRSVGEVNECCPVDLSVVSRHLAKLRKAGIVEAERRGKEVLYIVRVKWLADQLRRVADSLERCCPDGVCTIDLTKRKYTDEGDDDEQ